MKKFLGYASYTLCAFVFFLVVLFPSDTACSYVQSAFARAVPGYEFFAAKISLSWPLGIKASDIRLSDTNGVVFKAKSLWATARIRPLLTGQVKPIIQAKAYGGSVDARISPIDEAKGLSGPVAASLNFEQIAIQDIDAFARAAGTAITGDISGEMTFEGRPSAWSKGKGSGEMIISSGDIELKGGMLDGAVASFEEIIAKLAFKNGALTIENCTINSEMIPASLSGTIRIKKPLGASVLKVKGKVMPSDEFVDSFELGELARNFLEKKGKKREFSFTVSGTVRDYRMDTM